VWCHQEKHCHLLAKPSRKEPDTRLSWPSNEKRRQQIIEHLLKEKAPAIKSFDANLAKLG